MLQWFSCMFGRHRREGRTVWFDGTVFRGHCAGCGVAMRRELHGWEVDDAAPAPQGR